MSKLKNLERKHRHQVSEIQKTISDSVNIDILLKNIIGILIIIYIIIFLVLLFSNNPLISNFKLGIMFALTLLFGTIILTIFILSVIIRQLSANLYLQNMMIDALIGDLEDKNNK